MKGRSHLGDKGVNERKILKFILEKEGVMILTRFIWLRIGISRSFF
jgi:hypothetical protein